MVRLWHHLVRLEHRLRPVDRLRLVELGFVAGILLVLGLSVNVMISHEVLEWFAQDHEHYHALFSGTRG